MLDMKFVREMPDEIDAAMAARQTSWDRARFFELDGRRRALICRVEELQATRNAESKKIGALMRQGQREQAEAAKDAVRAIGDEAAVLNDELGAIDDELERFMARLPNIPAATTPVGSDESDNVECRRWSTPPAFAFDPRPHWELGVDLGILDFDRGSKLSGARFTVLAGAGAALDRALQSFFLNTHIAHGFTEFIPPVIVNREIMYGTGQLPKFEEDAYHVGDDQFLIPTAEVALTNLHAGEVLDGASLPLRYTAGTPCFREEAGSAGRDTRGIIRQHEFTKVEMVKFARPEESDDELESMTAEAELLLQQLELPYRVISLCTGDLGFSARQTYDIEVWLPSYNAYKEISSCSNCGDFQARRASIRYRDPERFKGTRFVHTLNGSGLPTGRTMAAIMENYQNEDGSITVPEVLRPYMGGLERIEQPAAGGAGA
ncbi:seryl-tRNA synthetase [Coriobacterium glomerans PW2]|uniref:Serine--tRNA ligase n=1 Tax=Coriobacterium glomerans (strain ATCC 49209 / DSM 20642 / JCM 10262 / PW2) TaxID=700015 RepID=F2N730_CORGP|nr:serine--tRNA ligase [Coriobacterium glomerans]AEB06369.1 seryl-tRNA synthetase [Coriobacterium glomerans PW2]